MVSSRLGCSNRQLGYLSLFLTGAMMSIWLLAASQDEQSRCLRSQDSYGGISRVILATAVILAVYSLADYYSADRPMMTGPLDNPAGLAACISMAAPFVLILRNSRAGKVWSVIITLFLLTTVVLSGSRAGVFAMLAWICVCLGARIPWKRRSIVLLFAVGLAVLFIVAYFLKKDSADGRLLIWRCSWDMIMDRPLFGYGHFGFRAHYMDYQANYFIRHPNSPYQFFADNVNHPFNELLLFVIRYGCVGLLLLLAFCFWLLRCFIRTSDRISSRISALSLLSVAVMSMFSYPFYYPYVWMIVLTDSFVLVCNRYRFSISPKRLRIISVSVLAVSVLLTVGIMPVMKETSRWQKATKHLQQREAAALTEFASLKINRRIPPVLLNNYTIGLYNAGHYAEALKVAGQCRKINADYELDCFLSLIYRKNHCFLEAENCCLKASKMCPSRFYPYYLLATLYQSAGMEAEARRVAETALNLPVKIQTPMVDSLKAEMKLLLYSGQE